MICVVGKNGERAQVGLQHRYCDTSFWPLTSAHLAAASPHMLETHDRNLDDDRQNIPVLDHAAETTDLVESIFAIYYYVLKLGAGHGATAGIAQSIRMHAS